MRIAESPNRLKQSLLYNEFIMRRFLNITPFFLAIFLLVSTFLQVQASTDSQTFVTPTPGPDGRILYVVQEGQNCSMISTQTGVPLSQLRSLNRLDDNCTLQVGQQLLIGMGLPDGITSTPEAAPATPTLAIATPTPGIPDATVCVLLYDDLNGDSLHQDTEGTIPNGAVSVTGTSGQFSQTTDTTASADPVCFDKVIEGTYNISVAAPEGYNPTTQLNYTLQIKSGEQIYVDFGAQVAGQAKPQDPANATGSTNLLGIAGGVLVLAAIGLGIYAWLVYGRRPKYGMDKTQDQ